MAEHVFDNHNSAVHQHARPEGEPAERHNVEGQAGKVHEVERRDDRYREREAHYQGGTKVA